MHDTVIVDYYRQAFFFVIMRAGWTTIVYTEVKN
jgi:hypothetical protein